MPAFPSPRWTASLVLGFALALSVGCSKEEAAFQEAQSANSIEAYEKFQSDFPENSNQVTVSDRLDELYYERAQQEKSEEAYKAYLAKYPTGRHAPEIQGEYEKARYKSANKEGTRSSLEAFLKDFPAGNYTQKAKSRLEEVRYFEKLSVSDVKVTKVNLEGDRRGPMNGWEITGSVTNTGDRSLSAVEMAVGPKGATGLKASLGAVAPEASLPFSVKLDKAPDGWDETTVAVDYRRVEFAPEPKPE